MSLINVSLNLILLDFKRRSHASETNRNLMWTEKEENGWIHPARETAGLPPSLYVTWNDDLNKKTDIILSSRDVRNTIAGFLEN